jgi:hypothetical protein
VRLTTDEQAEEKSYLISTASANILPQATLQKLQVNARHKQISNAVHEAIAAHDPQQNIEADVKQTIERFLNVPDEDKRSIVNFQDKRRHGKTPLILAAERHMFKVVQLLMDNNADVNIADEHGHRPMHYALGEKLGTPYVQAPEPNLRNGRLYTWVRSLCRHDGEDADTIWNLLQSTYKREVMPHDGESKGEANDYDTARDGESKGEADDYDTARKLMCLITSCENAEAFKNELNELEPYINDNPQSTLYYPSTLPTYRAKVHVPYEDTAIATIRQLMRNTNTTYVNSLKDDEQLRKERVQNIAKLGGATDETCNDDMTRMLLRLPFTTGNVEGNVEGKAEGKAEVVISLDNLFEKEAAYFVINAQNDHGLLGHLKDGYGDDKLPTLRGTLRENRKSIYTRFFDTWSKSQLSDDVLQKCFWG